MQTVMWKVLLLPHAIASGRQLAAFVKRLFDTWFTFFRDYSHISQIQIFNFLPGPGGAPQKVQTGLNAGIIIETSYIDDSPHFIPSIVFDKLSKNLFQGHALERVFGGLISHVRPEQH